MLKCRFHPKDNGLNQDCFTIIQSNVINLNYRIIWKLFRVELSSFESRKVSASNEVISSHCSSLFATSFSHGLRMMRYCWFDWQTSIPEASPTDGERFRNCWGAPRLMWLRRRWSSPVRCRPECKSIVSDIAIRLLFLQFCQGFEASRYCMQLFLWCNSLSMLLVNQVSSS